MTLDDKAIAAHLLRVLAARRSRVLTVDVLADRLGARRADVRRVVGQLHMEGFVDALRMRLTLAGLAVAAASRRCQLPPVRRAERGAVAA